MRKSRSFIAVVLPATAIFLLTTPRVTAQTATVPAQTAAVPAQTAAVPAQTAAVPAQTAAVPAQTAAVPAQTAAVPAQSVTPQKKELSFAQIFKGAPSGIQQPLPNIPGWIDDTHYREIKKDSSGITHEYSVDTRTGSATLTSTASPASSASLVSSASPASSAPATSSTPNGFANAPGKERNTTPSPDGKWVAFTRDNNLFARELATGKEQGFSSDGSDDIHNGYAAWVYYEEILGRPTHYRAFWWSPDSRHIAFMHFDESEVPVFPIYNSEGQHGSLERQHYPKAGDKNPAVKIGFVSVGDSGNTRSSTTWASGFNEKDDQYFGTPFWAPDGSLWVQWMPRSQDSLVIYRVDPSSGARTVIYTEHQKTWIDLAGADRIEFLPGGKEFILKSDRTGWMQLYLYRIDGTESNPITEGNYTVTGIVQIDEKNRLVYFRARKENSARLDFYKAPLSGKGLTRLSFGDYSHDTISLSPHAGFFITTYSNLSTPPRMALVDGKGRLIRELGDSKGSDFTAFELAKTELTHVKSADGLFDLPMTITYPLHFDPAKKHPVLISIYGGPNAGTVYDRWNNRSFLTSQWLAKEGVIQVAMDNRSSGHFGKTGMNYIYHRLGKYEIEDYMDCARWLRAQPFVDSSKICITGGSFGGYITCMALTYGADVFNYGIANYPVTDWSLYDSHYMERYMGRPSENPEGYASTSPQRYVAKYRGLLRISHGNIDDNVHMQNSIQFINRLEDLDKHVEFMVYPGERHGWGGPKAVYLRNESYLFIYRNLLNRPMPDAFWK